MDSLDFEIARFLARKAMEGARTTYQQVAEEIGWNHPNGRGLGNHLYQILYYCKDQGLPPLTTILVKKGERYPAPDALQYINEALGELDLEEAQQSVFRFDWTAVRELAPNAGELPVGGDFWLTSFWGFEPDKWGCIGFADEGKRNRFLRLSQPGALVAIYVTKGKGPENMRGKVVGILEVSHQTGHAKEFLSGDTWAAKESDPDSRGKWLYALKATRAWRVVEEDWQSVEDLLAETYAKNNAEFMAANGIPIEPAEISSLTGLSVYEVPVYGQTEQIESAIQPLENVLRPSRAVYPPSEPYWVGETDGPKHLYILALEGNTSSYLGRTTAAVDGRSIIKVGFSKSPLSRRDQIQAAYPAGQFNWRVRLPEIVPTEAPYPNSEIAIVGEDAMKKRLVDGGAESLGREFFLAEEWQIQKAWSAGSHAAATKAGTALSE